MAKGYNYFVDLGNGLSMMVGLPVIPIWQTKERPKKAKKGTFGFNSQTNSLEYWNGKNWYGTTLEEDQA